MTALYSNVNFTNERESKRSIVNGNLLQSGYTNENKSKRSIVNEPLSQKCSAKDKELHSTKKDESEYVNEKQKDVKNEVACDVTNYFNVSNVYVCGRNNPDVSYERTCMATEDNEYFTDILDTLNEYQDRQGQRLSSKKLKEALLRVIDEEEEEIERNINDSKEGVDDISDSKEGVEDRNDSAKQVDALNDSEILVVDGSDPKSDQSEATHTTNGFSQRKLFPLFIIASSSKTRSRASCRSPSFAVTSVSPM